MPIESKKPNRVNVAVPRSLHEKTGKIASILGKSLQECVVEAISDWTDKNRSRMQKEVKQLLAA
jgi:hypothetical protein